MPFLRRSEVPALLRYGWFADAGLSDGGAMAHREWDAEWRRLARSGFPVGRKHGWKGRSGRMCMTRRSRGNQARAALERDRLPGLRRALPRGTGPGHRGRPQSCGA